MTTDPTIADELDTLASDTPAPQDPELARILAEIATLRESLARSQADYRNLSSRMDRDRTDMRHTALRATILALLPIIDDLHRAIEHTPESIRTDPWTDGLRAIESRSTRALTGLGCQVFESVGQVADPRLHEVILSQAGPEGIILNEIERGYMLGDDVIRHAKVIVGSGEATPQA